MSMLGELYAGQVKAGRKKLAEVPARLKDEVSKILKEKAESAGE